MNDTTISGEIIMDLRLELLRQQMLKFHMKNGKIEYLEVIIMIMHLLLRVIVV